MKILLSIILLISLVCEIHSLIDYIKDKPMLKGRFINKIFELNLIVSSVVVDVAIVCAVIWYLVFI
jgi:hypothetical protein